MSRKGCWQMQLAMEVLMVTVTVVAPGCHTKNGWMSKCFFLWQRTNRKCKKMPYIHSIDKKLNQETRKAACCETFLCSNNIYIFSKRDKRYLVDLSCLHKFYSRVGLFSGISGNSYKESIAGIIHDH